jgi:hypothetical protein
MFSTISPKPKAIDKQVNIPHYQGIGYGKKVDLNDLNKNQI